jgi:hypothetical protein
MGFSRSVVCVRGSYIECPRLAEASSYYYYYFVDIKD